ncbi:hypothetical protein C8J57DRAFT_1368633 [Mycena rebaudengoi]|nr:hypothetical protein C8J57DRAFT_1368633 [Mycena rebaudengoi]
MLWVSFFDINDNWRFLTFHISLFARSMLVSSIASGCLERLHCRCVRRIHCPCIRRWTLASTVAVGISVVTAPPPCGILSGAQRVWWLKDGMERE